MRKECRQMDAEWAIGVFDKAPFITLSMNDNGVPYAVPLSIARTDDKTFYFHCAKEGRKLDILRRCPLVCLCAVAKCKPVVGPKDGSFTLEYMSAIAYGEAHIVEDDEEKITALKAICERFLPNHMSAFDAAVQHSLDRTAVVRVVLTEPPVGKRKQYDSNGDELKYGRME
ncbi:MAG: pyridoxamine 5'-phosphate oxidase family protein [Candidatus Limimorpha sp.]